MMIEKRPFASLGHANHGWLDARHHFSFSNYHDPARMGWGALRVWNDDEIAAKAGFPPHGHRDMEIITYVRQGAVSHKDSLGNSGRTAAGDVQVMSAGSGVQHSEYNQESETGTLFQIWIIPRATGGEPRWDTRQFPKEARDGAMAVLASGFDDDIADGALLIRADARLLGTTLAAGKSINHAMPAGQLGYLVVSAGRVRVNGVTLDARDGAAIAEVDVLTVEALEDSEFLLAEVPPLLH